MVLLVYKEGSKAYRLCDPRGGKVVVSRDVVFDEAAAWDWEDSSLGEAPGVSGTFSIKHLVVQGGREAGEHVGDAGGHQSSVVATGQQLLLLDSEPLAVGH